LLKFSLKGAIEDLAVAIAAEEQRDDPTRCTLFVDVDIPSQGGWPNLAGTEVTLKRGDATLEARRTDAYGKVVFEGIAVEDLAALIFEIARQI
jgi:hypothetical protein